MPWDRADAAKRYAVVPFSLMSDQRIGGAETLVWLALAGVSFVTGSSVVKAGHSWLAKASKLSRPTAVSALCVLIERGHVDILAGARRGRTGVYKLNSECFASPLLVVSDESGQHAVARENIEAFRKRLKAKAAV